MSRVTLANGNLVDGFVLLNQLGEIVTNEGNNTATPPGQTFARPDDSVPYTADDLIANDTDPSGIDVPSVPVARLAGGAGMIRSAKLFTDAITGMAGVIVNVDLWSSPPTFFGGDNEPYAVATGADAYLGSMFGTFRQFGDGAVAQLIPTDNLSETVFQLSNSVDPETTLVYWSLRTDTAFTPSPEQTFEFVPGVLQD